MSIFQKDCPQCAVPNPADAVLCACGYCFDPTAVTDSSEAAAVARHEERLYHDYLVARLVQAEAAFEVARTDAVADPDNTYKAAQALAAEQALNAARAELRAQKPAHQPPPPRATKAATLAVPARHEKRGTNRRQALKQRSNPPPRHAEPVAPPAPSNASIVATTRRVSPPKKPAAAEPLIKAPASHTTRPNPAFRARQAKKAAAIVSTAPAAAPVPSADVPPLTPPTAKPIAAATKECPNCTARVAANLTHCRCGFGFNAGSFEMASLPLDAAALALLRR